MSITLRLEDALYTRNKLSLSVDRNIEIDNKHPVRLQAIDPHNDNQIDIVIHPSDIDDIVTFLSNHRWETPERLKVQVDTPMGLNTTR